MQRCWTLSCESTVDLPFSYVQSRRIPVLFYTYDIDGEELTDDMGRDPQALPAFYRRLEAGALPSTSQLNDFRYREFFERLLEHGDVLHIAFGSGMTRSVERAREAALQLNGEGREHKVVVIDSYCSSSGYGLLVDCAADLRDAGAALEQVRAWVETNCQKVHHQFYSTDLSFYRRSGRISGPAATVGAILNICPLLHLNRAGCIVAYDKVRGHKAAIRETVRAMLSQAEGGADYAGKCFICHSNCPQLAEETKAAVLAAFPRLSADALRICDIGTIIAGHCGPGTVAVFFLGSLRPEN